jgi:hypothetical protein
VSRLSFRSRNALVGAAFGLLLGASAAQAQPCCAGVNLLTPARLAQHEEALVAFQAKGSDIVGSFDEGRQFVSPRGASEVDLEQDLIGTLRFLDRGQVSLLVPLAESGKSDPGVSQFGGGLGDLSVSARWDFINAREGGSGLPGVAVLAGITAPTGRPVESAAPPLGADATGTGAWQGGVGLAVEQSWRHLFAVGTALLTQSAPRHVDGISETLGLQFSAGAALGWAFDGGPALGATLTFVQARDVVINGQLQPHTSRSQTVLGVALAKPLGEDWRVQGALSAQVPISGLAQNEPSSIGLSVLIIRGWM